MNFLAHIFLSGDTPEVIIGNFIGDHVKGNELDSYPADIRTGIQLHRKIDSYTDTHPIVEHSKKRLRPITGKYAPVIADMFYDHFLATNWDLYSKEQLEVFTKDFYSLAESYRDKLPLRTRNMMDHMIPHNWLMKYRSVEGMGKIIESMGRRTRFDNNFHEAEKELRKNYDLYAGEFREFFPQLQEYCEAELTSSLRLNN